MIFIEIFLIHFKIYKLKEYLKKNNINITYYKKVFLLFFFYPATKININNLYNLNNKLIKAKDLLNNFTNNYIY